MFNALCALALFLSLILTVEARAPKRPEIPEDEQMYLTVLAGPEKIVRAPYYEGVKVMSVSQERLDFERQLIVNFTDFTYNIVQEMIVKKTGYFDMMKFVPKIRSFANEHKKAYFEMVAKEGNGPALHPSFIKHNLRLIRIVLSGGRGDLKKRVEQDSREGRVPLSDEEMRQEFMEELKDFMKLFHNVANKSPVGLYLDWSEMTINGNTIKEEAGYYIDFMRKYGIGLKFLTFACDILDAIRW